jgi:two-component system response regulator RegX3
MSAPAARDAHHHHRAYATVEPDTAGQLRLLQVNGLELDLDGHQLRVDGRAVTLALKEYELLAELMRNAGRVLSRQDLLDHVWEPGYPDTNSTLQVHIRRLRLKIEPDPDHPIRIRTVRGLGYIFDLEPW